MFKSVNSLRIAFYGLLCKMNNDSGACETHNRRSNMVQYWSDGAFGTNLVQVVPEFRSVAEGCIASGFRFAITSNLAVA